MAGTQKTNGYWLEEIEDVIDDLKLRRREIHRQISDIDFEADELWSDTERRWRRLESKLQKAEKASSDPLNRPRARNVDRLIEAIDDAYGELESLLD